MSKEVRPRMTKEEYELFLKIKGSKEFQEMLVGNDKTIQRLTKENKTLKGKYNHLHKENEILQSKLGIVEDISPQANIIHPPSIPSIKSSESVAFMILSDLHIEEEIKAEKVSGLNEYSLGIAKKRLDFAFSMFLKHVEVQRHGTGINRAVVALLGDMISGYIHDELRETNSLSPSQAIDHLKDWIVSGIEFLISKGNFTQIDIPCCVGNHGRTTQKKQVSTSVENSFEWILFKWIEDHYRGSEKVNVIVAKSDFLIYNAWENFKIRFHHGDSLRYYGGVGGLTIPANKKISNWNQGTPVNLDVFGHFHQFFDGGNFISNGSLIGYSPYAQMIGAKFEKPKQGFFLVEKDHGKTIVAPILVGEYHNG